jgi:hypothetical protein
LKGFSPWLLILGAALLFSYSDSGLNRCDSVKKFALRLWKSKFGSWNIHLDF